MAAPEELLGEGPKLGNIASRKTRRTSLPGCIEEITEVEEEEAEVSDHAKGSVRLQPIRPKTPPPAISTRVALPISATAIPAIDTSKTAPNLLRRGSQMLAKQLQGFSESQAEKKRKRRLSLKQFVGAETIDVADILLPSSKSRMAWELCIVIAVLVQLLYSPYVAAFVIFPMRDANLGAAWTGAMFARFALDLLVDLLYCVDIFIRSKTYFFSSKGDLVLSKQQIRRRYLRSCNPNLSLGVDVSTVIPLVLETILLAREHKPWNAWVVVRWTALLRFPRLLNSTAQVLRVVMYQYNLSPNLSAVLRLVSLFALLLVVSHWSGCTYFMLNSAADVSFAEQLQADDPGGSIYELSIYYALLALLGNDVPSHSRMFSTCLLVIGSALVAVIFGNMTVLLSNYDAQSRAYQEKLERVKQGLARMEVPSKLQTRVIK
jgi:hypothetical protein